MTVPESGIQTSKQNTGKTSDFPS